MIAPPLPESVATPPRRNTSAARTSSRKSQTTGTPRRGTGPLPNCQIFLCGLEGEKVNKFGQSGRKSCHERKTHVETGLRFDSIRRADTPEAQVRRTCNGTLRVGSFITVILSHAVVSGFTSGASVIIGCSQLKYVFGYNISNSKVLHEIIIKLIQGIREFNYRTFLMGTMSVLLLVGMKYLGKSYKRLKFLRAVGPLSITILTILITWGFSLSDVIPVVGAIPAGLPPVTANLWTPIATTNLSQLLIVVVSITIVGFMESFAISKQLASKHKYEIDSSSELVGLGMSNFVGSMFGSFPTTGSFSRSAVNNDSGATSGVSGITTTFLVGLVLLLLTPVFENLPLCVLAAVVISGVISLFDYDECIYLWKVHKFDWLCWMTACFGTMFLGVEIGLAISVVLSLLLVIYESAVPHTAVLGRLPGSTVYRNVKQYPEAEQYDGIVAVRIDAPIYFANTQSVREKVQKYEQKAQRLLEERGDKETFVKYIVLELSPVSHVDTTGLHILEGMLENYKERNIQLCLCNPSVRVTELLRASGFVDKVGEEHVFVTIHDAMSWCLHELDTVAVSLEGEEMLAVNSSIQDDDDDDDNESVVDLEEQAPVAVVDSDKQAL